VCTRWGGQLSGKIPKMISYLLLFLIGTTLMFGLRYTPPYGLPCNVMLKPYDFFSFSPFLPWLLIIFFAVLSVHLLLTRRFLDLNVAIAMVPILIFAVNWPYLIHHNVFSHNISTIEMLRGGRVESISGSHARLWPGFNFVAGFLVQITGLDIGTVNGIATVNVLMLSLFLQLMGVITYCITKKISIFTGNRAIMYSSLFMWIFLFNNRVMYELMFHHQWYAIVLLWLLIYLLLEFEISKRSTTKRHLVISMLLVSFAITITHPITGFMSVLMFLSYSIIRRRALDVLSTI